MNYHLMVIITCAIVLFGTSNKIRGDFLYLFILPAKRFKILHHNVKNWTGRKGNHRQMLYKGVNKSEK